MPRPALRIGSPAPAESVAAAMARALMPEMADVVAPSWLRESQRPTFRRAIAALSRYRGALIAEAVGTGKSYIALAVASVWPSPGTVCFVPAPLQSQWRATAATLGLPIEVWSHALVSRGRLPRGRFGLVIVDESHHYRNPTIRRYGHLAQWLRRRPTLLLSATPIVNRAADLVHQLLLAVRDDALRTAGLPSLQILGLSGEPHAALGHVVVISMSRHASGDDRPAIATQSIAAGAKEEATAARLGRDLLALRLAREPAVAELLRGVFWRALSSSLAALHAAVIRYRHLLLQASDATACRRHVTRRALRAFLAGAEAQLVLWPMIPDLEGGIDLTLEDIEALDRLQDRLRRLIRVGDPKLDRLTPLLENPLPTIVFVTFVETLHAIRRRVGLPLAWCSGREAGVGSHRFSRETVLATFAAPAEPTTAPHVLVTTDVTAEGLDLQRAGRVIHFDLPWTAVRLEQRSGRAARIGSRHRTVAIVRFEPAAAVERAVRGGALLARKTLVSQRMGMGAAAQATWRWRASLAEAFPEGATPGCVAYVPADESGVLAGITVGRPSPNPHGDEKVGAQELGTIIWLSGGEWTESPPVVSVRLFEAACAAPAPPPDQSSIEAALLELAPAVEALRQRWAAARWATAPRSPAARRLLCRLRAWAVHAARARDAALLGTIDAALGFVAGGHTAGEDQLLHRLAEVEETRELLRRLRRLPPAEPVPTGVDVRISGLLLFGSGTR